MSYTPVLGTITDASLLPNTSNATFDALALKAPLADPVFTGFIASPSIKLTGVEQSYTTGTTISVPTAGKKYLFSGSSQTYIISPAAIGEIFFVAVSNGCPYNIVNYTDAFGAATTLSMNTNTKYYYMFQMLASGFAVYGGSV